MISTAFIILTRISSDCVKKNKISFLEGGRTGCFVLIVDHPGGKIYLKCFMNVKSLNEE